MKNGYKIVALVIIALLVGVAIGWYAKPTPPTPKLEKVVLALDWLIIGQHAPIFTALDKGYYEEAGLSVEVVRGFGSADTVKRVEAGTVTFGYGDYNSIVISRAEGGKVKAIGVVFSKGPWTVFYRKEVGIKGPKDLEGKTVAGAGPGDIDIVLLPALCKVAGVDFNKINVISVDWGSILPMLLARKVDASVEFVFRWANLERDAKAAGVDVGYFLYADYGLNMYSNGFMTRDDVIKNKPELVRGFIKATMKGYKYAFEHPDEAIDILLKYNPELDREVARKELDIMRDLVFVPEIEEHGLGWMSKERWTTTRDMVTELFNLTTKVPVEDLYTNEFLE